MRTAILVRHAESAANVRGVLNGDARLDAGLSEAGREQARALGARLGEVGLAVTSSFRRTAETAAIACPGAPVLELPELGEIHFGSYEGGDFPAYREWAVAAGPAEACPGGGESRVEAVRRYVRGYRFVLAREESTVLVVAHGLPIRYALDALAGCPPRPLLDDVPCAEPFEVAAVDLDRALDLLAAWAREPRW